ncbi:MAG: VOC family protein [Bacteroidetes bacterium]|nr:VOC family protein [Bacteroidota bacterium]MBS1973830.1 VOC family protein [Bacteroidota bacterium]
MKLNPYLMFAGNAEEAMNFYVNALGGAIAQLGRYGESPMPSDEDWKQKIMHAKIEFDDNILMISDASKGEKVSTDGNIQLAIGFDNEGKAYETFNKLAKGGTVTLPLAKQFWGDVFGMLKDKFGVSWMINSTEKK